MKRRRLIGKAAVSVGSSIVWIDVVAGATSSGEVELKTDATVLNNTTIDITVYEDTNNDDVSDRSQAQSIDDGVNTYILDTLEGTESRAPNYWADIEMTTSDDSITPELDSMEIAVPRTEEVEPKTFDFLFPDSITTTFSIILFGLLSLLTWISATIRSPLGLISVSMSLIVFVSTFTLGIPFVWFWIMLIISVVLIAFAGFVKSI